MEVCFTIFLAGALGALAKDIFKDNQIEMPKWNNGKLGLGFLGGMVIGGVAGMYIDGSFITAFMAGFTGVAILQGILDGNKTFEQVLIEKEKNETVIENKTTEETIREIAKTYGVDPDLAVRVAIAESNLNATARNINAKGSIDRGIYQINNLYHPEVTDKQADDIIFATKFFCQAVKDGNISWWNASKEKWSLTK
ncbi:MAG: transglycosylase SLT domain-containing protein [Clostridia bacterium]|nr:transglycosylase SLT domain-containing protein [Clostridia bacterium]